MKRSTFILTIGVCAVLARAQSQPAPRPLVPSSALIGSPNRPLVLAPKAKTNRPPGLTNALPLLTTNLPPIPPEGFAVFESKPYACIVLVPGAHPDDISVKPEPAQPTMRTITPELRLLPRNPSPR